MMNPQELREIKALVRSRFKTREGLPFNLTDGQAELFALIAKKKYPRIHIETTTRYGKSDVTSMAALERVNNYPEKWAIIAKTKEKARIIMDYAIGHIFDNEYYRSRFILEKGENEENIRRYRQKNKINFDLGKGQLGEIFIGTAADAMGLGSANVIEDESALIDEKEHALVMRMLGDQPDNFLCKIGNPWYSDHFNSSFEDPKYHKLIIDFRQAIREGRLKPEYVDEMRKQPFFDILYECKHQKLDIVEGENWIPLFSKDEIDRAMVENSKGFGIKKLGVDVAGGGRNFSVIIERNTNVARIVHKNQNPDTMTLAETVIGMSKDLTRERKYIVRPEDIFIDKVGIGKGVYDIVQREIPGIYGVNVGEEPTNDDCKARFANLRAELYWKVREWILGGGKLERSDDWYQLLKIKYWTKLQGTKGKMIIISKEELNKKGIQSPDVADALMLTFRTKDVAPIDDELLEQQRAREDKFDPFSPFGEL